MEIKGRKNKFKSSNLFDITNLNSAKNKSPLEIMVSIFILVLTN